MSNLPEVIILGYDGQRIAGGIVAVTEIITDRLPYVRLLPIKHCYNSIEDGSLYLLSLARFLELALSRRKRLVVHGIVGSRGDRVRTVPALVICAALRIPICLQYHKNVGGLVFKHAALNRLIDRFYRLCHLHVFISETLRTEFVRMAPWVRDTAIVGNALPDAWMNLPAAPLEQRDIDVVFFGRWNPEKGIDVLIEYLNTTPRQIRCEIYTDHAPPIQIRNAVVKPWVGEDEVRSILGRAKLLVLPSYFEAYPTVILEALACGTPFVATDIGGIPDIARESQAGVVVPPGDAMTLGAEIEELLDDTDEWKCRSGAGRAWANKSCSAERIVSLWRDIYYSIAENR